MKFCCPWLWSIRSVWFYCHEIGPENIYIETLECGRDSRLQGKCFIIWSFCKGSHFWHAHPMGSSRWKWCSRCCHTGIISYIFYNFKYCQIFPTSLHHQLAKRKIHLPRHPELVSGSQDKGEDAEMNSAWRELWIATLRLQVTEANSRKKSTRGRVE